ncbi:hypothetical protein MDUV_49430 [Mycolicibacterium duvalii]|uniref:DNA-binding response regulator n=2 Tax=Mycolicibacterium duvalii TaxID=39688 RepID=A0A7I7K7Q4_9MYCO|nr:hypothetical protein MDUV_49430 [Mycolicibacterium duvalii]
MGSGRAVSPALAGVLEQDPLQQRVLSQRVGSAASRDMLATARVVIIDDIRLQREALATILDHVGVSTTATAWDFASVVDAADKMAADIVLLSMTARQKIDLLRVAREAFPQAKVIVVGIAEDDEEGIIACAEAGAAGYHLRTDSLFELLNVISRVVVGESACPPVVSTTLLRHLTSIATERRTGSMKLDLTTREMQILRMLEMGLSNRDIADRLCISLHTVKNHVHAVLSKLGVNTRAEAAALVRSIR